MNMRDTSGVVHFSNVLELTVCLEGPGEGWTFTGETPTCVACLASINLEFEFRRRIALAVSKKSYVACMQQIHEVKLRRGDTLDYKHTFDVRCQIYVDDDGDLHFIEERS